MAGAPAARFWHHVSVKPRDVAFAENALTESRRGIDQGARLRYEQAWPHGRRAHLPYAHIVGPDCPHCRKQTYKRARKRDGAPFWGCSAFPKCKGVIPIDS